MIFFFGDNGFKNMFVYQPTFSGLVLKEEKNSEYVIALKSKELFKNELYLSYSAFLSNVK